MDNNNYRSKWEQAYGVKIPKGMELHHINLDSSDNSLNNLALVNPEGHATLHEQAGDYHSAELIRSRIIRMIKNAFKTRKTLLRESLVVYSSGVKYSKYVHSAVEVLSATRNPRGYVDYELVDLNTGEEHVERMYDSILKKMRGQYHPVVGEKLNIRLSHTKTSNKVFMAISDI